MTPPFEPLNRQRKNERYGSDPNSHETKIYLQKRRGFVRLAMQHGSDLVPVFIFGEKRCYKRVTVPASVSDWLLRVGLRILI